MWSYGNEISERAKPRGIEIAKMLVNKIKKLDDSRPTTQAICHFWDNPDQNWEEHSPAAFEVMDIAGYNYKYEKYESDHKLYPNRIMYGSESIAKEAFENWKMVEKHPYIIGDFVWTGMDYIGESGIGYSEYRKDDKEEWMSLPGWPWFNAWCGDIDLIGNKKPQSLYRDVVWHNTELEILVHEPIPAEKIEHISYWGWPKELNHWNWNGKEGDTLSVNVYSSYPKVKLELNGKIIGEKKIDQETGITATFKVPYQKGELKATGIRKDNTTVSKILKTAGKPAKLNLKAERHTLKANRNEIVYIHISVVDSNNNVVPTSTLPIEAEITGVGELIAAGNGSPYIEGSIQDHLFNLYNGRGLVIIRSNGKTGMINLKVKAENNLNRQIQIMVD
jgi:beta-galactosidase